MFQSFNYRPILISDSNLTLYLKDIVYKSILKIENKKYC